MQSNSSIPQPNAYLKTKVLTASPQELRLMLFDGAIRFAEAARAGIQRKNHEEAYDGVTRCQAILMELINSLRPDQDEDLCRNLSAIYTFMYSRLIDAARERDAAIVDEVLNLLRYERETWVMLMDKLAEENALAAQVKSDGPLPSVGGGNGEHTPSAPGIIGGRLSVQG